MTVRGIDAIKIAVVTELPNSGVPELSSNIDPTAAIAVIQAPNKNTPLFGVTIFLQGLGTRLER